MNIKIGNFNITSGNIFKLLMCINILTIVAQIYMKNTEKVYISNETIVLSIVILIASIYFAFK